MITNVNVATNITTITNVTARTNIITTTNENAIVTMMLATAAVKKKRIKNIYISQANMMKH